MQPLRNKSRRMPARGAIERDAFTGWRKVLCYIDNIKGIRKWAKRQYNRRFRRTKGDEE